MSPLLRTGQAVFTITKPARWEIVIREWLGEGGQGEVYGGDLSGEDVAVKVYFPHYPHQNELRARLQTLINVGAPSERFLWPMSLVDAPQVPSFGYAMKRARPPFLVLTELWDGEPRPPLRVLATLGMNLAQSFLQVHAKGLCYRDISARNIFYDPSSGEIRIADNDNVGVKDEPGEVAGTWEYMAPEVARGEVTPNRSTDLHSLAVVLFQIFLLWHPLLGKKELLIPPAMSQENAIRFYGKEPVFIFDPVDHSNEPIPGSPEYANVLRLWPQYPLFLRNLFTRAFTAGLHDALNGRVAEGEWRQAFSRLRDSVFHCPACGVELFFDEDATRAAGGKMQPCDQCGAIPRIPPHIKFGVNRVMLNRDTQLYPHHVDNHRQYDFSRPVAAVSAWPPPTLQNLSTRKWVMRTEDGATSEIPPGGTAALVDRGTINFGTTEGAVRL
jgi:eukaryotic-like serine/threonine-protein kinase